MKKLFNVSHKKINLWLIFSITMLLLVNSCRKDKSQNLPLSKTELIAEARSYFEDEVVNVPQLNDNNLRHSLDKTPLWDKASTRKISIGEAVIVPIKYEQKIKIGYEDSKDEKELEKTSYLMLYKDKKQKMQAEWVTLLPTATSNGKKFVGTLIIEQWDGKFKRGYAIGDDEEVFSIEPSGEQIFKKIAYKRREYCFTINHYGYISVGGYNGPQQLLGSESFCSGTANNGETQKTYGSSEGGGTSSEDYTYTIDCAKVINGMAYWDYGCNTCMGGTTGITECPPLKVNVDPNARPCLEQIKSQLEALGLKNTSKSSGLIANVLNKLNLSTGANFNAIINERVINSTSIAQTIEVTNPNPYGVQGTVAEITFNSNHLDNMTDLSVAATMMHEYVHAYFDWNFHMIYRGEAGYDANFISSYNLLFKDGNPNSTPDTHHNQMAKSFASEISSMLKQYADEKKIPYPADPEYFTKMGWIGLMGTDAAKYAPAGTAYTLSAETKSGVVHLSQALNCKK